MDFLITFFRDILSGPVYIVVAIISGILICSCIGYLAERSIKKREKDKEYTKAPEISVDTNIDNVVVKSDDGTGTLPTKEEKKEEKTKNKDIKLDMNKEALKPTVDGIKTETPKPDASVNNNPTNNQNVIK